MEQTMECRVEFDYDAQETDELTLKKGDHITNVVTKMDGWWEGTLSSTGKRGMFPDNFVKVITSHSNSSGDEVQSSGDAVQLRSKSGANPRRLKALFSYSPEQEDELHLEVGDVVDFIAEVEEGWWRGELKGRTGIFPSNFVSEVESSPTLLNGKENGAPEITKSEQGKQIDNKNRTSIKVPPDVVPTEKARPEEEPAPKLPPKPVREVARCFYPYPAQNEDELNLEEGDIVLIISKECEDEGWWRGEVRGKIGVFPDNFVQIISPNEPQPAIPFPTSTNNTSSSERQATVTASERTSDDSVSGISKKREPSGPKAAGPNSTTVTVDGVGNSKLSFDKEKETPPAKEIVKKSSGLFRSSGKESPVGGINNKSVSRVSPLPGSGAGPLQTQKSVENSRQKSVEDPVGDFNEIERGEKLVHLTANRAKAPRRRPPSTGTPKENEGGVLNGSYEETSPSYDNSPAQNTPYSSSLKTPNANSAITTPVSGGNENVSYKETPSPSPAVPKTQAAPWLAELRKKQDKKLSPVQGQQPLLKDKDKDRTDSNLNSSPAPVPVVTSPQSLPPVSAARHVAPPLPAKPTLPQMSPAAATFDRQSPTSPNANAPPSLTVITTQSNSSTTTTTVSSSTNILTNNNLSNVASKFGGQKRTVTAINHTNSSGDTSQHMQTAGPGNGSSGNQDWVPYEEHAKLKEKVAKLELELELVKKQLKLFLDNKSYSNSTGHIV